MTNWFYLLVEKLLAHSGKVEKPFPPTEDEPYKVECIGDPQLDEGGGTWKWIRKKDVKKYLQESGCGVRG